MRKLESLARKECANYCNGKCLGVMFQRVNGKLIITADSGFMGKDCIASTDKCTYFNQIVVKGKINATR